MCVCELFCVHVHLNNTQHLHLCVCVYAFISSVFVCLNIRISSGEGHPELLKLSDLKEWRSLVCVRPFVCVLLYKGRGDFWGNLHGK